ncbi:class I SAM-dependent methyltransferase [Mycoplasma hafezii]|uniref:class I SAM-dependent methyltransferase n=1 Tax=Mycoplasma hafezii TaxID=525886 RepID=UPI003CF125BA
MKQNLISSHYDTKEVVADYIEYAKYGLWNSEKVILESLLQQLPQNLTILDIGCGAGRTSFALAKWLPNAKIDAIDISPAMINQCVAQNKFQNLHFEVADISKYPLKSKYDLIFFSFNGITNNTYQAELEAIFTNVHWMLKDRNSIFLFTVHDMFSNPEFEHFWKEIKQVDKLELFSDEKILTNQNHSIIKNRFFTKNDIYQIAKLFNFKVILERKRDENSEFEWVKTLSTPVIFYAFSKLE